MRGYDAPKCGKLIIKETNFSKLYIYTQSYEYWLYSYDWVCPSYILDKQGDWSGAYIYLLLTIF